MTHLYHEKQHLQHCLKHALNNLLQREAFSLQQLNKLTDSIGAKRTWILGNFDANVLAAALVLQNMEVKWHDARDSELSSLNPQQVHPQALHVVGCSRDSTETQTYNPAVTQTPAVGQQESVEEQEQQHHHLQHLRQRSGLQQHQDVADGSSSQRQSANTQEQRLLQDQHPSQQQQESTESSSTQPQQKTSTQKLQQQQQQHQHNPHYLQQQEITDSSVPQPQETTSTQELLQQQHNPHQQQQQHELQHPQQLQQQEHVSSSQQQQPQQDLLLVGLIVNVAGRGWWSAITGGRHWLAIKYIDGHWWNLDSDLSAPEAFPEPASNSAASAGDGGREQLTHYLQQQLAQGAHIIAIYQHCASW